MLNQNTTYTTPIYAGVRVVMGCVIQAILIISGPNKIFAKIYYLLFSSVSNYSYS